MISGLCRKPLQIGESYREDKYIKRSPQDPRTLLNIRLGGL